MSIQVINEILDGELMEKIIKYTEDIEWKYGSKTTFNGIPFWHKKIKDYYKKIDITQWNGEDIFSQVLDTVELRYKKKFDREHSDFQVYFDARTMLQDSDYSTDSLSQENQDGRFTFMLYSAREISEDTCDMCGYTEFRTKNGIISVEPKCNRGVLFKSGIEHRCNGPATPNLLRVVLVFKLKEIN